MTIKRYNILIYLFDLQDEVSVKTETPKLIYIYTQSFIIYNKPQKNNFKPIHKHKYVEMYTYIKICT